jgi:hypothetical protein
LYNAKLTAFSSCLTELALETIFPPGHDELLPDVITIVLDHNNIALNTMKDWLQKDDENKVLSENSYG